MKRSTRMTGIIVLIIVILITGYFGFRSSLEPGASPSVFDGSDDTDVLADLIRVTEPAENAAVDREITIRGEARGTWYFEGDFPIDLEDATGEILTQSYATAQEEWMTEEFVPFKGTIIAPSDLPSGTDLILMLKQANASGLPENDREIIVQIKLQ